MRSIKAERIVPTIGLNIAKISRPEGEYIFWDLGGQESLRKIWNKYFEEADAIVYVIDGADEDRFEEAKTTLKNLMEEPMLEDLPHLILLNKSDLEGFKGVEYISDKMKLYSLRCDEYIMLPISALKEKGITSSMNWIMETIKSKNMQKGSKKLEENV